MKLVILDRDGVSTSTATIHQVASEWRPTGIDRGDRAPEPDGYRIASHQQAGIGRGLFDMATLNAMNDR